MIRRYSVIAASLFLLCAQLAFAQTRTSPPRSSFVYPGDSISCTLGLESGDVLHWSLWLAPAPEAADKLILTVESSVEGEHLRREFSADSMQASDQWKVTRAAEYRVTAKTTGRNGRVVVLSVWAVLSQSSAVPFPSPAQQRLSRRLVAGDRVAASFDFELSDKLAFTELLALELPRDIASLKMITPVGDTLASVAAVSRWLGDLSRITLRERAPQGGRITLRLEVEAADDGDATLLLAPGAAPPSWVPSKARVLIEQWHNPWHAVVVPPIAAQVESLAVRAPDAGKAMGAALSLRRSERGLDSLTILRLLTIYAERDSLAAAQRAAVLQGERYEDQFLVGRNAFLPPDMHIVMTAPLAGASPSKRAPRRGLEITWFEQSATGAPAKAKLIEWNFDEARLALPVAPDEWFWDGGALPLRRKTVEHEAASAARPATITLTPPPVERPADLTHVGERLLDSSRRVWGFYLQNPSPQTLYLVFRQTQPYERSLMSKLARWPKGAKILLVILGVAAVVAVWAVTELRQRERRRRRRAEELAEEMEKARQVQLKLLPEGPLTVEGLEVYGIHQSMQLVGGDYYDFFPLEDGRVLLCVADVTGHGLAAALLMSNFQATLRAVAHTKKPISEIAALLNHEVYQRTSPENFITMLLAEVSADRSKLTYCNAGHNPGYIIRRKSDVIELTEGGIMVGVMDMYPYAQAEVTLKHGDLIAFYTDGIPEAEVGHEDMFGYERLKWFFDSNAQEMLPDIARELFRRVTPSGPEAVADDMALVLVRIRA